MITLSGLVRSSFRRRSVFVAVIAVLHLLTTQWSGAAVDAQKTAPRIVKPVVATTSEKLLVFASLQNGFTDAIRKGVHNGIPVAFTFQILCEKMQADGTYQQVAATKVIHHLAYDSLKKVYLVDRDQGAVRHGVFASLEAAEKEMGRLDSVPLVMGAGLQEGVYRLRIKAKLVKKTLPFKLHVILPFFPQWNMETDWATLLFQLKK